MRTIETTWRNKLPKMPLSKSTDQDAVRILNKNKAPAALLVPMVRDTASCPTSSQNVAIDFS